MERLTFRYDGQRNAFYKQERGGSYVDVSPNFIRISEMQDVLNQLAAYEDTGLMPEDFAAAGQMEHFKEWREWHKADTEKRRVILPCKVGDTVYRVWKVDGRKTEITEHKMENIVQIAQWLHLFGKTVFVLRTEAEAYAEKER